MPSPGLENTTRTSKTDFAAPDWWWLHSLHPPRMGPCSRTWTFPANEIGATDLRHPSVMAMMIVKSRSQNACGRLVWLLLLRRTLMASGVNAVWASPLNSVFILPAWCILLIFLYVALKHGRWPQQNWQSWKPSISISNDESLASSGMTLLLKAPSCKMSETLRVREGPGCWLFTCCCCDSPAALLLSSVVQVTEVCDCSRVVPYLHCELRRMALTVEQMFYGVWYDEHLICRWWCGPCKCSRADSDQNATGCLVTFLDCHAPSQHRGYFPYPVQQTEQGIASFQFPITAVCCWESTETACISDILWTSWRINDRRSQIDMNTFLHSWTCEIK